MGASQREGGQVPPSESEGGGGPEDPSPATGLANYDQPAPPPASPARPPACTLDLLHQPPPPYPAAGHLVRGRGWQGGSRPLPCSPVFLGDQWTWHLPSAVNASTGRTWPLLVHPTHLSPRVASLHRRLHPVWQEFFVFRADQKSQILCQCRFSRQQNGPCSTGVQSTRMGGKRIRRNPSLARHQPILGKQTGSNSCDSFPCELWPHRTSLGPLHRGKRLHKEV